MLRTFFIFGIFYKCHSTWDKCIIIPFVSPCVFMYKHSICFRTVQLSTVWRCILSSVVSSVEQLKNVRKLKQDRKQANTYKTYNWFWKTVWCCIFCVLIFTISACCVRVIFFLLHSHLYSSALFCFALPQESNYVYVTWIYPRRTWHRNWILCYLFFCPYIFSFSKHDFGALQRDEWVKWFT